MQNMKDTSFSLTMLKNSERNDVIIDHTVLYLGDGELCTLFTLFTFDGYLPSSCLLLTQVTCSLSFLDKIQPKLNRL
uniref:Uncharacterized protein n=1 Tax=Octopus bimaculoides TaxID=37653 RepID=A0A0L8H9T6_OCTBM